MNVKKVSFGVAALLFLVSCGNKQETQEQAPTPYETMVLSPQDATLESTYPATIKGEEDIEIKPRIDGFIEAIYVDEGSVVKKGQVLFKINSPSAEQSLRTAQASVTSAEASLNTAKLNRDRMAPLVEKGIVSQVQYDTYANSYEVAQASLAQARATLANAQATLSWTNVTSPVDGIVGQIPFRLGSLVSSANTLTTVANTSNVYVYFSLNEKELIEILGDLEGSTQAEKIKNMPQVSLTLANGNLYAYKGKVSTITGLANVSTGSVSMRADFPNPEGILRSGFSGKVIIPREIDNTYVIPQAATFSQQDKVLTYVVKGDSVVQTLIQVLPMPDGKNYVVTEGLSTGDRVVTEGLATLQNGKRITVK